MRDFSKDIPGVYHGYSQSICAGFAPAETCCRPAALFILRRRAGVAGVGYYRVYYMAARTIRLARISGCGSGCGLNMVQWFRISEQNQRHRGTAMRRYGMGRWACNSNCLAG
jgi:hypothetical protein